MKKMHQNLALEPVENSHDFQPEGGKRFPEAGAVR